jgi:hypothetical protein
MPSIVQFVPSEKGGPGWGLDADSGRWIPVDPNVLSGSTLGNLGRGAALGFQQLNQGQAELQNPGDPTVAAAGQKLDLLTEAAQNAAPWTTSIGLGAPEMAAGAAVGMATAGLGLPAVIGGQALSGFAVGAARPGSDEQRLQRGALEGLMAGGGTAATMGILSALGVGKAVGAASENATAKGVLGAMAQREAANARAALAGAAEDTGATSVGAAGTPLSQMDPQVAVENQLMNQMDRQPENQSIATILDNGRAVGVPSEWWAPSNKFSPARTFGAANEFNPFQSSNVAEEAQDQVNRLGAHGGLLEPTFDKDLNTTDRLTPDVMGQMHQNLIHMNENNIARNFPQIPPNAMANTINSVQMDPAVGGGGEIFTAVKDKMLNDLAKMGANQPVPARTFMNTMSFLSDKAAQAGAGATKDTLSLQAINDLRNQLYDLIENASKDANGNPTLTSQSWADLRRGWQTYYMLRHGNTVDLQGNINIKSLVKQMLLDRSRGGFGETGPPAGTPQRALFDGALAAAQNDTMRPPTGARLTMHLGRLTRGVLKDQAVRSGGLGALGYGAASSIWGSGE